MDAARPAPAHAPLRAERLGPARRARGAALARLALLELRRAAPPAFALAVAAATWVAARSTAAEVQPVLRDLVALDRGPEVARAAARSSALALGLALAAAWLVPHAAGAVGRWRRGDGDWLGARPVGRTAALGATAAGLALAAGALVGAVLLGALASAPGAARALAWRAGPARHFALAAGERYVERLDAAPLPPDGVVRVRLRNTALDLPFGTAELSLEGRDGAVLAGPVTARVVRPVDVEVPLPEAPAGAPRALAVVVRSLGPGTLAVEGPRPVSCWGGPRPAWRGDAALAARALALLVAAVGLALGAGAWVAPALATLGTAALAVALGALLGEAAPDTAAALAGWLPGAGLGAALERCAAAEAPAAAPFGHALGAAAALAAGVGLARAATASWRHAP